MENLASTSLTYEIIGCNIICTSLNTSILGMALSSLLQTMLGKGGERKAHRVNCLKTFVHHCRSHAKHETNIGNASPTSCQMVY